MSLRAMAHRRGANESTRGARAPRKATDDERLPHKSNSESLSGRAGGFPMGSLIQVHPPINSGKEFSQDFRIHLVESRGINFLERLQDSFHRVSALVGVME